MYACMNECMDGLLRLKFFLLSSAEDHEVHPGTLRRARASEDQLSDEGLEELTASGALEGPSNVEVPEGHHHLQ